MFGTDSTGAGEGYDSGAGGRRPNELRALSALVFEDLRAFPGGIQDMHLGIAERAFRNVGPASRPVQVIHDTLSRRAYDAIGAGAAVLGRAVDVAIEQRGIGEEVALSTTVVAALNGLIGDRLERSSSDLHQPASVRVNREAVALDAGSVSAAFPDATGRLVVFLHGLMGNEFYWDWGGAHPGDTYGARLASDLGCTPIYLRYNTGLHVSENGLSVTALLEELVGAWPVKVQEIALVGHSMGGLVARSACHQASESGSLRIRTLVPDRCQIPGRSVACRARSHTRMPRGAV
jgi:pimeloyl-ACP methyl ester carboxylesterase